MARKMSELVVKLTDQVSGPARKVAQALKMAERQTKAIAAATKAGLGNRFTADLQRMGASAHQIDRTTRAWEKYRRETRLAADSTKWTKSQIAAVRQWERAHIAALRNVNAAKRAPAGWATPASQSKLAAASGGLSAGQGALIGAAASRAALVARAAPVVAAGAAVYKATTAALDFEKVLYQVQKATDSSGAGLERYSTALLDMSVKTGSSGKELGSILAAAGFAGRPQAELLDFTAYAAKAANAWETTAGETGQALAEIGNIYQANQKRIEEIGDAINGVADASASKETDLLDFIRRTGATATILGITAEQALAFGAAFREIGVTSEIAATGMNALLMKLATGVGDGGWEGQIKALGVPVKEFNATLKKDAPAAIKVLLGAINKIDDGTKKMSVLKEMFGQEYADDIARLASNLGGLERMLGFVGNKAKFLGSVGKSFELLKEKDYNRIARFSAQMDRLAISVGGPLKSAFGMAADEASRLFESFQPGGAGARVVDALNEAAKRYVSDQIAQQELAGEPRRDYDPATRAAIEDRRRVHEAGRAKEERDAVDNRVSAIDAQIAEKQARLDSLPNYPRLRAKPEGEVNSLKAERQAVLDALSARDRATIELIEADMRRKGADTRLRSLEGSSEKPRPLSHDNRESFGFDVDAWSDKPTVPMTQTMRTRDRKGRKVTQPLPLPPARPDRLPKAVPMLKSFEDIYAPAIPQVIRPEVDSTAIEAAKDKAAEASEKLEGLNATVSPRVNLAEVRALDAALDGILAKYARIGEVARTVRNTASSTAPSPPSRGRSDIAQATANLSRSRETNQTGREFT